MPSVEDRDDNDRALPKTQTDMAPLLDRFDQLEDRMRTLEQRFDGSKVRAFAEAYGMTVTGRFPKDGLEMQTGTADLGDTSTSRETYSMRAARVTLELAEKRVRDYMTGHFSDATIGGVVQALRG
jgi:hypothetical protein